ncbi:Asp-tRNA(Asn)/Glu-tRNA(Gln) amidotransferase subunit GatC [Amphibacillus sp. Q70]|uniref:Asp-tRNA(Asn)/Glu-tRNA(Gln) amidotransferase subunit GatC n=1 Tax=Amphibacillus sp. Q70 TaxID=3453416 RepID=UPI003F83FCFD
MPDISKEQVKKIADVARLAITEEEIEVRMKQLSEMMKYATVLNDLDTSHVEPTTHVLDFNNVMRKDEPRQWISQEEALKNAPNQKDGQFRVPSILE